MTEIQLIERARQGDSAAIEALYAEHSARVYAVVRRLAGDDASADDWAQEAWLRAIRALPNFRGQSRFSTWLHRIAVNCALYGRRRLGRQHSREAPLPEVIVDATPPDQTMLRRQLQTAMDQLPQGMRRVLVLHDIEGYTHEEIGDMLGVTAGTCKSQLFKARARMREILQPAAQTIEGEGICSRT